MALFGKYRDISLFRGLNRELINRIIDTNIDIYKLIINPQNINLYGEDERKVYYEPIRIHALIDPSPQTPQYSEFGVEPVQNILFHFLRDELKDINIMPETGDIFHWDDKYWEATNDSSNQYQMRRNPDTGKSISEEFGWNISISITAFHTRKNKIQTEKTYVPPKASIDAVPIVKLERLYD